MTHKREMTFKKKMTHKIDQQGGKCSDHYQEYRVHVGTGQVAVLLVSKLHWMKECQRVKKVTSPATALLQNAESAHACGEGRHPGRTTGNYYCAITFSVGKLQF